ncbi:hypothetical protein FH608_005510 [Nonomuraea phyllanthi]|uniref:Uncharacterized protein n=1 Tax=Nonomuraea phyllanthi TaxID=2219224 RepID=A0A5C4WSF1_9ACTN|nr:hypothetical protein [Nonomuraea phyllanthi]KAB8196234.1 hypothetical protein FH608_005510 [Nonomuraea phyllanthi]
MTTIVIFDSSTRWGSGETRCCLCASLFTYDLNQKTIPGIKAPDLCPQGCGDSREPNTHKGGCPALGGDICATCLSQIATDPESIRFGLRVRIKDLLAQANVLTAYLAASEWKNELAFSEIPCPKCGTEIYRRPGEDPLCTICE